MTDTTAPTSAGMTSEEKTAAAGFTVGGLMLFGPAGAIVALLAVGIEQAFIKSGWDKPDFLERLGWMTPEEAAEHIARRRAQLLAEAEEHLAQSRAAAKARAALLAEHRKKLSDWIKAGREGDKPDLPDGALRNPWEFLKDAFATSKATYRLFENKMDRANAKVTGAYPKIAEFLNRLWRFGSGFAEGIQAEWQRQQQQRKVHVPSTTTGNTSDGPNTEPATPVTGSAPRPAGITAPGPDPVPAAGSGPGPAPAPTPLPTAGQPGELSTGPAGPREGTVEGDVMTADGAVALPGPKGETGLDRVLQAFIPIPPLLGSVRRQLPDLHTAQGEIARQLNLIRTLASIHGVPTVVWNMLEEAQQVVTALDHGLKNIGVENEVAQELAEEALMALAPAQDDQTAVHSAGATGDLFADAAEVGA